MNIENVLLKEYELRVNYLVVHFQRMWTKFNLAASSCLDPKISLQMS